MNHKHIARTYLNWFGNESQEFADEGTVQYAPGTDFVERYNHCQTGTTENAVCYVRTLADARLDPKDAQAVIQAAETLLRPT